MRIERPKPVVERIRSNISSKIHPRSYHHHHNNNNQNQSSYDVSYRRPLLSDDYGGGMWEHSDDQDDDANDNDDVDNCTPTMTTPTSGEGKYVRKVGGGGGIGGGGRVCGVGGVGGGVGRSSPRGGGPRSPRTPRTPRTPRSPRNPRSPRTPTNAISKKVLSVVTSLRCNGSSYAHHDDTTDNDDSRDEDEDDSHQYLLKSMMEETTDRAAVGYSMDTMALSTSVTAVVTADTTTGTTTNNTANNATDNAPDNADNTADNTTAAAGKMKNEKQETTKGEQHLRTNDDEMSGNLIDFGGFNDPLFMANNGDGSSLETHNNTSSHGSEKENEEVDVKVKDDDDDLGTEKKKQMSSKVAQVNNNNDDDEVIDSDTNKINDEAANSDTNADVEQRPKEGISSIAAVTAAAAAIAAIARAATHPDSEEDVAEDDPIPLVCRTRTESSLVGLKISEASDDAAVDDVAEDVAREEHDRDNHDLPLPLRAENNNDAIIADQPPHPKASPSFSHNTQGSIFAYSTDSNTYNDDRSLASGGSSSTVDLDGHLTNEEKMGFSPVPSTKLLLEEEEEEETADGQEANKSTGKQEAVVVDDDIDGSMRKQRKMRRKQQQREYSNALTDVVKQYQTKSTTSPTTTSTPRTMSATTPIEKYPSIAAAAATTNVAAASTVNTEAGQQSYATYDYAAKQQQQLQQQSKLPVLITPTENGDVILLTPMDDNMVDVGPKQKTHEVNPKSKASGATSLPSIMTPTENVTPTEIDEESEGPSSKAETFAASVEDAKDDVGRQQPPFKTVETIGSKSALLIPSLIGIGELQDSKMHDDDDDGDDDDDDDDDDTYHTAREGRGSCPRNAEKASVVVDGNNEPTAADDDAALVRRLRGEDHGHEKEECGNERRGVGDDSIISWLSSPGRDRAAAAAAAAVEEPPPLALGSPSSIGGGGGEQQRVDATQIKSVTRSKKVVFWENHYAMDHDCNRQNNLHHQMDENEASPTGVDDEMFISTAKFARGAYAVEEQRVGSRRNVHAWAVNDNVEQPENTTPLVETTKASPPNPWLPKKSHMMEKTESEWFVASDDWNNIEGGGSGENDQDSVFANGSSPFGSYTVHVDAVHDLEKSISRHTPVLELPQSLESDSRESSSMVSSSVVSSTKARCADHGVADVSSKQKREKLQQLQEEEEMGPSLLDKFVDEEIVRNESSESKESYESRDSKESNESRESKESRETCASLGSFSQIFMRGGGSREDEVSDSESDAPGDYFDVCPAKDVGPDQRDLSNEAMLMMTQLTGEAVEISDESSTSSEATPVTRKDSDTRMAALRSLKCQQQEDHLAAPKANATEEEVEQSLDDSSASSEATPTSLRSLILKQLEEHSSALTGDPTKEESEESSDVSPASSEATLTVLRSLEYKRLEDQYLAAMKADVIEEEAEESSDESSTSSEATPTALGSLEHKLLEDHLEALKANMIEEEAEESSDESSTSSEASPVKRRDAVTRMAALRSLKCTRPWSKPIDISDCESVESDLASASYLTLSASGGQDDATPPQVTHISPNPASSSQHDDSPPRVARISSDESKDSDPGADDFDNLNNFWGREWTEMSTGEAEEATVQEIAPEVVVENRGLSDPDLDPLFHFLPKKDVGDALAEEEQTAPPVICTDCDGNEYLKIFDIDSGKDVYEVLETQPHELEAVKEEEEEEECNSEKEVAEACSSDAEDNEDGQTETEGVVVGYAETVTEEELEEERSSGTDWNDDEQTRLEEVVVEVVENEIENEIEEDCSSDAGGNQIEQTKIEEHVVEDVDNETDNDMEGGCSLDAGGSKIDRTKVEEVAVENVDDETDDETENEMECSSDAGGSNIEQTKVEGLMVDDLEEDIENKAEEEVEEVEEECSSNAIITRAITVTQTDVQPRLNGKREAHEVVVEDIDTETEDGDEAEVVEGRTQLEELHEANALIDSHENEEKETFQESPSVKKSRSELEELHELCSLIDSYEMEENETAIDEKSLTLNKSAESVELYDLWSKIEGYQATIEHENKPTPSPPSDLEVRSVKSSKRRFAHVKKRAFAKAKSCQQKYDFAAYRRSGGSLSKESTACPKESIDYPKARSEMASQPSSALNDSLNGVLAKALDALKKQENKATLDVGDGKHARLAAVTGTCSSVDKDDEDENYCFSDDHVSIDTFASMVAEEEKEHADAEENAAPAQNDSQDNTSVQTSTNPHRPELKKGTSLIISRLYDENIELAEALAATQSELEKVSRKLESVTKERDEIIATARFEI